MDTSSEGIAAENATIGRVSAQTPKCLHRFVPTNDDRRCMHFFFRKNDRYKETLRFYAESLGTAKTAGTEPKEFTRCSIDSKKCLNGDDENLKEDETEIYLGSGFWSHCEKVTATAPSNDGEGALLITLHQKGERMDTET